jgi:hypothetical protein
VTIRTTDGSLLGSRRACRSWRPTAPKNDGPQVREAVPGRLCGAAGSRHAAGHFQRVTPCTRFQTPHRGVRGGTCRRAGSAPMHLNRGEPRRRRRLVFGAGRRARTGGRVMGVRAVERAGGRQGGEGCRAEREEQKPKSRSAPRGACDGAGRSWPPARRPRVEVVACTVACRPRPEPASSIGRRPRSPGRRRPARPRPRRAGRWATLEVDHGLDASRDQPPPHVDDRAGRRQRHSLQTCRHLVRHAAWSVVSRPWWPVFAACSMSITSAPRTSTTIRSGQMRSALRTSAWSGDGAAFLDVGRPCLEAGRGTDRAAAARPRPRW